MSAEVSEEVVADEPADPIMAKIRSQGEMSSAIRDYLDASERFESASKAYSDSSQAVREIVKPGTHVVVRFSYSKHYLLTRDDDGFTVESIEVI